MRLPPPHLRLDPDQRAVLRHLRRAGPTARSRLADALALSNARLTRVSTDLIALGLVEEGGGAAASGRGRPAVPLRISPAAGYAVGATVHRGTAELVLVDYAGGVVARHAEPFDDPDPRVFADLVDDRMHRLALEQRMLGSRLLGIGIGVPGPSRSPDGRRRWTVDSLGGWRDVDLPALFEERLGQRVWIENDANAAALAEYYLGGLMQRCSTAIVILLGHGIGAGTIADGRLLRGEMACAGEIGCLYPTDAPRPSTVDLIATLRAAGGEASGLPDLDAAMRDHGAVVDAWMGRAAVQIAPIIHWGLAWIDPGAFVISSPLPPAILRGLVARLDTASLTIGDHRDDLPPVTISALGGSATTIGAALLPVHATSAVA